MDKSGKTVRLQLSTTIFYTTLFASVLWASLLRMMKKATTARMTIMRTAITTPAVTPGTKYISEIFLPALRLGEYLKLSANTIFPAKIIWEFFSKCTQEAQWLNCAFVLQKK